MQFLVETQRNPKFTISIILEPSAPTWAVNDMRKLGLNIPGHYQLSTGALNEDNSLTNIYMSRAGGTR